MSKHRDPGEGGLWPLAVLVGMMLLVLAYGISRGFLTDSQRLADRPVRLVVAFPGSGDAVSAYRAVAETFEQAHPEVAVDLRPIFGPKYYQKVLVMMASGSPPDLMWMGQGFAEFAQRGAFLDVTERVERDIEADRFIRQALEWYRVGGQQLGVPFLLDLGFIVYNKELFDQAGLAYPSHDWTYEQFLEAAKRLTADIDGDGHIDRYGYCGQLDACLFGATFISDDGTHALCDSPAMIQYLRTNLTLVNEHQVAPSIQQQVQGALDRLAMFRRGQVAMLQAFTWDLPRLHEQMEAAWGITLNPVIERRATWASSQAVLISARTDHPDEAWALAQAFLEPGFQSRMAHRGMPSDLRLARQLAASGDPVYSHLSVLLEAVDELCPTPRVAHLAEAQQIFGQACESVWTGRATPQEAMQRAAQLIDRMIQQHQRYGS